MAITQVLEMRKAQRSKAWLKLGLSGASGSGKTLGALLVAYGLMKEKYPNLPDAEIWEKIAIIDTENGSGELYVGRTIASIRIGVYNTIPLTPPYEADKYTRALELCEQNGIEVAIIDSVTHLWSGEGGLLEQQGNIAKRTGNSYTAWRDITPQHNRFVDKMLQSQLHIIATVRAKQEYVQEKGENGKTTVRKVGMEPEFRKGMEFEFTIFLEINSEHEAFGSKDRTSMFDQKTFKITPSEGRDLMKWLETGVDTAPVVVATMKPANKEEGLLQVKTEVIALCKELGGRANPVLMERLAFCKGNPNSITDEAELSELRSDLIQMQEKTN